MQVFLCFIFAAKNDIMIEERLIGGGDLIVQRYVDILTDAGFKAVFGDQRNKDVLNTPTFREKRTHEVPDETISLIFTELDRFDKPLDSCESLQEKWCYSLKHVGKLNELPDGLRVRTFERLFEACEIARFSPEKKLQYESDMITERDYYNILETAKEDGEARGREAGLMEGEAKGIGKVAKAMLASGMPVEQIASLTGLSAEEIGNL